MLIHILGDLRSKTIVFMGLAEKGKTPVAQAIATCYSEYLVLKDGVESEHSPGFRICSSLDQLRDESGLKYRPDILDDADSASIPVTKLKSFLDSSLAEAHTVERWTAARFVKGQLRILCDNKVDEDAEKGTPSNAMTVNFKTFMEMTAPAFPEKLACKTKALLQAGTLDREYAWGCLSSACRGFKRRRSSHSLHRWRDRLHHGSIVRRRHRAS